MSTMGDQIDVKPKKVNWLDAVLPMVSPHLTTSMTLTFDFQVGWGLEAFLNMWASLFNLFMATTKDVWIIPSFLIWLCAVCWAHSMCHHECSSSNFISNKYRKTSIYNTIALMITAMFTCTLLVATRKSWGLSSWPTSVSHPFSSLNNSLGLAGGKHYQKITIPIKILLFQVAFLIFFSIAIFSLYFLLIGLLLQYVALFQSSNQLRN